LAGNSVAVLALLCPKCGKIKMHEISRFTIKDFFNSRRTLNCSCGQRQLAPVSISRFQYLFKIFCLVCDSDHLISFDSKKIWQPNAAEIYCPFSHMELGLAGNREAIEKKMACQKNAASALAKETARANDTDEVENPAIMLEILNRIHEIAEQDSLYCGCSSASIKITLLANAIELSCLKCDGRIIIPAKCEADRAQMEKISVIELRTCVHSLKIPQRQ
jgi:hypothetical protein